MSEVGRKKILYVITKSNWGGAQTYVYTLATYFKKEGSRVAVALGGTGQARANAGLLAEKLADADIQTIFVQNFMRNISLLRECKAFFELVRIFKKEAPDIVHLNSSKAGGIGALAGRIAGVQKVVFTSHGLAYDEDKDPLTRLFRWLATWLTFMFAHQVILISKDTFERARRMPLCGRKVHLVYNGTPPIEFSTREEARAALCKEARDEFWVGTIGELTRNKGLSYLIDAAAILKKRGLPFTLCIIGEGEDRAALATSIAKNDLEQQVRLLGFVPHAAARLKAFDIFPLTSIKEGLPYVLLEAGAAGCAVVASRIPGATDIVDRETGILVEPRDPAAIADAIETLMRDPRYRQSMREKLRARVNERFSTQKMAQGIAEVYLI